MTPTKLTGNDGASHDDLDAKYSESEGDLDKELPQKQKRTSTVLAYEVVKRWVTGERAEKDDAGIQLELENEVHNLMELSRQKQFSSHKSLSSDLGLPHAYQQAQCQI